MTFRAGLVLIKTVLQNNRQMLLYMATRFSHSMGPGVIAEAQQSFYSNSSLLANYIYLNLFSSLVAVKHL
jgi:hypothetical protein